MTSSIYVTAIKISKAVLVNESFEWSISAGDSSDRVKTHLNNITEQLQKLSGHLDVEEKITVSLIAALNVAGQDVLLAVKVECELRKITLEQFQNLGSDLKEKLSVLFAKSNQLADSDTCKLPQVIVMNEQLFDMTSEELDGQAIAVKTSFEKNIFYEVVKLAQLNKGLKYKIDGVEARLKQLPVSIPVVEAGKPIVQRVYVSYHDYVKLLGCVVFLSNGKRIRDLRCDDQNERQKLEKASKLECEVDVRFATEVIKRGSNKSKTRITKILEVLEIYEDRKYPKQQSFEL